MKENCVCGGCIFVGVDECREGSGVEKRCENNKPIEFELPSYGDKNPYCNSGKKRPSKIYVKGIEGGEFYK